MKALLITVLAATFILTKVSAQQKTLRYCTIQVYRTGFNNSHFTVKLDAWKHNELFTFRDTAVVNNLLKVTTMDTPPDVLNYMAYNGWTLVQTLSSYLFIFKREFDPSELEPVRQ